MAASDGIRWFTGPGRFAQRLSIAESQLEGKAAEVVEKVVDRAADTMLQIIDNGGVNKTKKGGPRIDSGDMQESVNSNAHLNARGRVQGEFGFIDGAPDYTVYQERGTRHISPMLAYATALDQAIAEFDELIETTDWFPTMRI